MAILLNAYSQLEKITSQLYNEADDAVERGDFDDASLLQARADILYEQLENLDIVRTYALRSVALRAITVTLKKGASRLYAYREERFLAYQAYYYVLNFSESTTTDWEALVKSSQRFASPTNKNVPTA